MKIKPFHRRWLLALMGMVALALLLNTLFPALPATPRSDTTLAGSDSEPAQDGALELNVGDDWYTSNVTSMYNGTWFTAPMDYTLVEANPIYEGDIVLNLNSVSTAGSAVNRASLLWPGGVLVWELSPSFPAQYRVFDAIEHWEEKTGIRFIQRTADNASKYPNYVRFVQASGCWSYVGMQGGMQQLGLALGCTTGSTIHEIGHALGLWHEQSRIDRDEFVTIHFDNIISSMAHNFARHVADGVDVGAYDYNSIMHYPRWAFSKNGKDTIVPKTEVEIGQRTTLSDGDIAAIQTLYGK